MIVQNWWMTTLLEQKFSNCECLRKEIECDVLIIGGGMSGVSAAASFIGSGLKIVLIDRSI